MAYTGMELLMENLKMLIYNNDNPVVNNHPSVLSKRPEIRLLYEELNSMSQILFVEKENDIHELEELKNLKKRFRDLTEEAHNIVGLFVYAVNFKTKYPSSSSRYDLINDVLNFKNAERPIKYKYSLDLKNVMKSVKSIRKKLDKILDNLKTDSSLSINRVKTQPVSAAGISRTKNPVRKKKVVEEMVVGLKYDAGLIRDKLVEDQKQLDVVSVVGMGGIGKTTVAAKVFNDPFVVYHFHVRVWVTVSQTYEKQDLLIQILSFMDVQLDLASASYSRLREVLHKSLMGKRYLIVIDDIWSNEAWDDMKLYFPNDNTGSRILLTSRLKEVALYAKSHGFVHQLECLTDEESWELLCKKVFRCADCPEWLIETGKLIAKNCYGLPLAVVVIGGILSKEALTKDSWEKISQSVSSHVVSDRNGFVDILALSYDHLPPHLKDCFLYLGASFPEDDKFQVRRLIWLWMAEGFIREAGNRSSEKIGEEYLQELVDRNLVIVINRKLDGAIKTCSIHDLLRELCLEKATQEGFCLKRNTQMSCLASMRPRRIFTNVELFTNNHFDKPSPTVRSLVCLRSGGSMINITDKHFYSYPLLMVLDLQKCKLYDFPKAIELLVHLRYLAFWYMRGFPSSLCNLWSLQTLVTKSATALWLPKTISNLVNLRHLKSDKDIYFDKTEKPMHLQTISDVKLGNGAGSWVKNIPAIKTLKAMTRAQDDHDFEALTSLETLVWITIGLKAFTYGKLEYPKVHMRLPTSLRKLSLTGCYLPWSDMSIVQSLPNLEVLKILDNAFLGPRWEIGASEFQQLKYLKLQGLNIQQWEVSSTNFPCLEHLMFDRCKHLEEIPLEVGDIPTLKLIDVDDYSSSVIESLDRIWEEQQNLGNYDLKINVRRRWTANFLIGNQEKPDFVEKRWMAFLVENQEKSDFGDGCIKTK